MQNNFLAPTNSHETDLLRFVTIRNGQIPSARETARFIAYPPSADTTTLYARLANLDVSVVDLTSQIATECQLFKASAAYFINKDAVAQSVDIAAAERIFNGDKNQQAIVDYFNDNNSVAKSTNENTANTINSAQLWDNFFLQLIEGKEDTAMLETLCLGIKMSHLLANETSVADSNDFFDTAIIIPETITNLLKQRNNIFNNSLRSDKNENFKEVKEVKDNNSFLQLMMALNELKTAKSRFYEKQQILFF